MLEFYWSIGRDLETLCADERWGAGVVKQFALDMRQAFPNITGFSDSNIKYIRQWYSFYYERIIKSQQAVGQLNNEKSQQAVGQLNNEKSQQLADLSEMPKIFGPKIPKSRSFDHFFGVKPCGFPTYSYLCIPES